ncbi:DUF7557 family protein [Halovivax cerinus]|uniref:Uncharacterized protein n=1 Tax=Halovivax cerinus TaxID=1487865 RepID=A0ABD5NLL2_9EURY|nr:hypothetical protein [Halovivax cerinus]
MPDIHGSTMAQAQPERTTVDVSRSLHQRLEDLKPYESVSFNDLIAEMADVYESQQDT